MSNCRFVFQESQYKGALLPCTLADFNRIVDSQDVSWRISTRQQVDNAITKGLPLDDFLADKRFQKFCQKHQDEAVFQKLTPGQKLTQWTNQLKMGLPCFIFGAKEFSTQQRKLEAIKLSGLFMFDADHLPISPKELYERTQVENFPWKLCLAHVTSSGHGLRLVCRARPELGNIADNQVCLARQLELLDMIGTTGKPVVDDSCIDASRISYTPRRQDILLINEQQLFESEDDTEFETLFGEGYRKGQGHCNPTKPENRFHDDKLAKMATVTPEIIVGQNGNDKTQSPEQLVFGHPVVDYINTMLPNGVPQGSRHNTMLKLANDLIILLDNDETSVKKAMQKISWVQDLIQERGEKEVDNVIDSAKKLLKKRESESFYTLRPSKNMVAAIEELTHQNYSKLLNSQNAMLGNKKTTDEGMEMLLRMGRQIRKFNAYFPLLKLFCHRRKPIHYVAALFVGGGFCTTLMTRCWYSFYPSPGKKCRINSLVILVGRPASGKSFAVELYKLLMEPIKKADQAQIDALNAWNQEREKNNGASQSSTARPKFIYRCLPAETSAAAIREAEFNAVEVVDGEKWPLHVCIYDSELNNTLNQMKKSHMDAFKTLWLKSFHNEAGGALLKTSSSPVGEFPIHFNAVYTGTFDAFEQIATEATYNSGTTTRFASILMGSSNFEMMEFKEYTDEDKRVEQQIREWAYKLDATIGEIPTAELSKALYQWTARKMEEAREEQSEVLEEMCKRPAWVGINFALPFIVSRHWSEMVQDDNGKFRCGAGFHLDKHDIDLALFIAQAQYDFQQYFFFGLGQKQQEKQAAYRAGKKLQSRTKLSFKRLPDVFTSSDVMREYGYDNSNSVNSCLKRLQDDGRIKKIRSGEDKGKYRKV